MPDDTTPMTSLDYNLIAWFIVFTFTAIVFEPLYYFGCDWSLACPAAANSSLLSNTRDLWAIYVSWDPLFDHPPLWLRVLCTIEVFLFGPLYALTAYGLYFQRPWLPAVAYSFSGALVYSTIVYFLMEILENVPGTNFTAVFLVNIPWTIVPLMLVHRLVSVPSSRLKALEKCD